MAQPHLPVFSKFNSLDRRAVARRHHAKAAGGNAPSSLGGQLKLQGR